MPENNKEVEQPVNNDKTAGTDDTDFKSLSFIEKCKKDPVIPISILLAFLAVIIASVYFILPNALTPSMGITLEEFKYSFTEGEVAKSLLSNGSDIGFRSPAYVDPESNPGILGDKEIIKANRAYADFFAGPMKYFSTIGIEGATRKNDGELVYVRIYVKYNDLDDSESGDFNNVWMYFSNTLNALYPELSLYESMGIAMEKLGEYDGDIRYYVRGDYGFRLVPVQRDDNVYIVIDVVPKSALNDSLIRETLEVTAATEATDVSASDTVTEST